MRCANRGVPPPRIAVDSPVHADLPSPPQQKHYRRHKTTPRFAAPGRIWLGVIALALAGVIGYSIPRGDSGSARAPVAPVAAATPTPAATPAPADAAHAHDAAPAQRAARTADEEAYIRALWPIHGEVERVAMRLSLGQIFYKTQDMPRADLKARVDEALAAFQAADKQLRALAPPASLKPDHDTYLTGVLLFRDATTELRKMFADGSDDHMAAAYPRSQEASDKIRDVGGKFWPHEFPPH